MPLDELAPLKPCAPSRTCSPALLRGCARGVSDGGALSAEKIEREQHAAHGLAWLATYVEAIKELAAYARRMQAEGRYGETEELLTRIGLGEYLAQIFGGIADEPGRDRPSRRLRPQRGGYRGGRVRRRSRR